VSVAGGALTYGFTITHPRARASVGSFRISKSPVTVAEYAACVAAGACTEPALGTTACQTTSLVPIGGKTFDRSSPDAASLPVTCAKPTQAIAYCAWVGGVLPTTEEWLMAARGSAVRRYPWGDAPPSCDHHPGALRCDGASWGVGVHATGAAASGMQDAL